MSNYRRGADFERRVRDRLYKDGAALVVRAAQSRGKVDLLALWPVNWRDPEGYLRTSTPPKLVQCKTRTARMSSLEKIDLVFLADQVGGVPILAEPGLNGKGVKFTDLRATAKEKNGPIKNSSSGSVPGAPRGAARQARDD